jgi:excisionase family DNA binding protein
MSRTTISARKFVSIQDAADRAQVSTKFVRRRIADGSLVGYRMGPRLIRVDLDEFDALLRPIPSARGGAA